MTDAARREHESLKKKVQPKLSLSLTGSLSRNSVATPPRHNSGNLTPPVTPPITPSSSFRSSTPTGSPIKHTLLLFILAVCLTLYTYLHTHTSSVTAFMFVLCLLCFLERWILGNNCNMLVWCSVVIDNKIITFWVTVFFHSCCFPWPSLEQHVLFLPQLDVLGILFLWVWNTN